MYKHVRAIESHTPKEDLPVAIRNWVCEHLQAMTLRMRTYLTALLVASFALGASAQIDSTRRELVQLGYNQPLIGKGPLAAYGFYFLNKPNYFNRTNLTLRLALAPVYMDSELGVAEVLGPNTDIGFGMAGGGFADSYSEVHNGKYEQTESFRGHGGEISSSLYHLFNPGARIPLYGLLRGAAHYSAYMDDKNTDENFALPDDQFTYRVRAGFRWGGREPLMLPDLAMELSVWYEGEFRTKAGRYGYSDDRVLEDNSHLYWARALLNYTFPESKQSFGINLTAGTGTRVDRLNAYRIGGNLPLYAEFPLSLPGYYFQELTATTIILLGVNYNFPIDARKSWWITTLAATAYVDYFDDLEQPRNWNSGLGGGVVYRSPTDSWQIALAYGYGVDAIRNDDHGAHSISILVQFDLDRTRRRFFDPTENIGRSRGLQSIMRNIFR